MTIGRNADTEKLGRNFRFIIDDPQSLQKLAYVLSKPLKVGNYYNGTGVYKFVLQESVTTKDDNIELGIADYYKHFPTVIPDYSITTEIDPEHNTTADGKGVYL